MMDLSKRRAKSLRFERQCLQFARKAPTPAMRLHWIRQWRSWRDSRFTTIRLHRAAMARAAARVQAKIDGRPLPERAGREPLERITSIRLTERDWDALERAARTVPGGSVAGMVRAIVHDYIKQNTRKAG